MKLLHNLRRCLWGFGYDIIKYDVESSPVARRRRLIEHYAVEVVLDVGANVGQYAKQLRNDLGYRGRIISFEPLSSAFDLLKQRAENDADWEVHRMALGGAHEQLEINVSRNSESSSILGMHAAHLSAAPDSAYVSKEPVQVRKLDSVLPDLGIAGKSIYLKMDTQGYESQVLKGAEESLKHIDTIQMEMALTPLYKGELLFLDMCRHMADMGYTLVAIENGFSNKDSGQLLQVDGIFHRA